MEERIFFKFTLDIPDIDKSEPDAQTSVGEHQGELMLRSPTDIMLKIFYQPQERLDRKIMGRDTDYSYTLLSKFNVTDVKSSYGNLLAIDLKDYEYSGMEHNSEFHEAGLDFFTIQLTGIKLIYKDTSDQQPDSEIYLNGTAFNLIELHYRYHFNLPWKNDSFKWEPTNRVTEWVKFNDLYFIPEHRFYNTKSCNTTVSLEKHPRLRIKHNGLNEQDVKTHVNLLCNLYSFYCHKEITWTESKIFSEGKLYYEVKRSITEDNRLPHGIFIWDFIQNPLNLIRNVDSAFLFKESSLVARMITRFNYSFKLSDESKFMILYGLLEELRNQYIQSRLIEKDANGNPNRAKEEYGFILKPKDVDKEIGNALKNLVKFVESSQQEMFRQDIKHKVFGIRVLSMADQFRSYYEFIKVDPEAFGLDFAKLKSLRDKIFHGRKIDDSLDTLRKAVWFEHLPRFTGILLLKFFGIDSLNAIKKERL